jgi:hypothetical protein
LVVADGDAKRLGAQMSQDREGTAVGELNRQVVTGDGGRTAPQA